MGPGRHAERLQNHLGSYRSPLAGRVWPGTRACGRGKGKPSLRPPSPPPFFFSLSHQNHAPVPPAAIKMQHAASQGAAARTLGAMRGASEEKDLWSYTGRSKS